LVEAKYPADLSGRRLGIQFAFDVIVWKRPS